MKKVIQIIDETGAPVQGHVFIAPTEETLALAMADLPEGRWFEVASEADLVVPEVPSDPEP